MKTKITKNIIQWAAITMLLMYVFSLGGYYAVYGVLQFQAKQTMHNLIANSVDYKQLGLEKIQVHKNNADNITADEDEFTFKGKRYDVVYAKVSADSIILYCIWDKNEEAIVNAFHQYQYSKGSTEQSNQQKTLLNLFKMLNLPGVMDNKHLMVRAGSDFSFAYFYHRKDIILISEIYSPPKFS